MIRSMTGFAALTRVDGQTSIGLTIRSVNHRYLDVQVKVPQGLSSLEPGLRALVQRQVSRGRIELTVSVQSRHVPAPEVELNDEVVRRVAAAVERARELGFVEGALNPGDLLRLPMALLIREPAPDAVSTAGGEVWPAVEAAVAAAVTELNAMRVAEGAHLKADLDGRRAALADLVERIAVAAQEGRDGLVERLARRVADLAADLAADQTAIAQEIVRTAARSDISEETVRVRAHLAQWASLLDGDEPCGRRLDFLLQELNREVNTIGSKADGAAVSALIVEAKGELEKAREQVQNVE